MVLSWEWGLGIGRLKENRWSAPPENTIDRLTLNPAAEIIGVSQVWRLKCYRLRASAKGKLCRNHIPGR